MIKINVKTFYGMRKVYSIKVNILEKIGNLINIISTQNNCKDILQYNFYRIIYSDITSVNKKIKELSLTERILDYFIPDNTTLLFLDQDPLILDSLRIGNHILVIIIKLSSNNLTATKKDNNHFNSIFASLPISFGKQYWEIKV